MSLSSLPKAVSLELVTNAPKNLTLREKIKYIATHISVEPLIFFYILSGTMGLLTTQNTHLEKACRVNLKYNSSVCDALLNRDHSGYEDYQETEVQKMTARMLTYKTAASGFFPTILVLFLGSWSDRHGKRKPVILYPIFCDIISGVELILCSHFFMQVPIQYVALSDCFPYALGGGWTCVFLGVFSYISGISTPEERTLRIGAVSMFQSVGLIIGNILGGTLIRPLGLTGSYIVSDVLMLGAFIYGIVILKEVKYETENTVEKRKGFLRDFFEVGHIKNTFKVCFKTENRNRKWKMIVIMVATVFITGPLQGEMAVIYLYTRKKFGWNEVDYTLYNTVQFILQISGSVFALSFFSKKLKLDDALLGVIALTSKVSACILYALAPKGTYFF
ncbi:hypothetical protein WA026_013449 [Henosepilachna vigintioctopunctata]|uniref:Proton-coupled folate transporter n=1 Tax=Henosepilachna vigintioctopunctata TaxID=420089 RepID=A0AAW1V611_9CUCU